MTLENEVIWDQFGAAIDMLEQSIIDCPEELWNTDFKFWYIAYHTLFFLDYYLSEDPVHFSPPSPFNLDELSPDGLLPARVYNKKELLDYLKFSRKKCHEYLLNFTEEKAKLRFVNHYRDYSFFEQILNNMRHVQHHTAQLNLYLRQTINYEPTWISRSKNKFRN